MPARKGSYLRRSLVAMLAAIAFLLTAAVLWSCLDVRPRLSVEPETWDGVRIATLVHPTDAGNHPFDNLTVAYSPDRQWFVTLTGERAEGPFRWLVQVWQSATGKEQTRWLVSSAEALILPDPNPPQAHFSPDGRYVTLTYCVDRDLQQTLRVLDIRTGQECRWRVRSYRWSPDGRHLAFVAGDQRERSFLQVVEMPSGRGTVPIAHVNANCGRWPVFRDFAFLKDKRTLAFVAEQPVSVSGKPRKRRAARKNRLELVLWDVPSRRARRLVALSGLPRNDKGFYPTISPVGDLMVNFVQRPSRDEIQVWDVANGRIINKVHLVGDRRFFEYACASADESALMAGAGVPGPDIDNAYRVTTWDLRTGQLKCRFENGKPDATGAEFRVANNAHQSFLPHYLLCGYSDEVEAIIDLRNGQRHMQVPHDFAPMEVAGKNLGCALSPDQRWFILSQNGKRKPSLAWDWLAKHVSWFSLPEAQQETYVRCWDMNTKEEFPFLPKCGRAFAFAPDGRGLATVCDDGRVRVWDLPSRKPVGLIVAWACVPALLVLLLAWWRAKRQLSSQAPPGNPPPEAPPR